MKYFSKTSLQNVLLGSFDLESVLFNPSKNVFERSRSTDYAQMKLMTCRKTMLKEFGHNWALPLPVPDGRIKIGNFLAASGFHLIFSSTGSHLSFQN